MSESTVFKAAIKLAQEQRVAYLDQTCAADPELRREVESLLRAHDAPGSFLQDPPARPQATVDNPPILEGPGTVIGPYKLLQQIGEGGMGVVYMAEQQEPVRRKVALKIIKPGMDSRQVIARFEAERQALALMDHPNIARVLGAGTTDTGRPYFVMELVHGVSFTRYCDDNKLTPRQRLELFVPVCHAVQHAHQKGIIHRDLKPSNILVTMYDDKPVPKVIDFGVAKAVEQRLTEKTLFTQFGALVGTFEYMSPEQAEMNAYGVDTRSDIYSLGVLLYELLTGTTPLEGQRLREAAYGDIVRLIKEEEPPRPSTRLSSAGAALAGISQQRGSGPGQLTELVRGELDWIVMRCLEKDRTRRYETANALARDVDRYLKDEPVEACPPTTGYRLRKFARKHRRMLATAAAFAALLLFGVAASTWQAVRATEAEAVADGNATQAQEKEQEAKKERDEAQRQRDEVKALNETLRWTTYVAQMNLAQYAGEAGGGERVRELLEQHRPKKGERDLRGFEWHYLDRLCPAPLLTLKGHTSNVVYVVFSPNGNCLASASSDKTVKVWDAQTGKQLLTFNAHAANAMFLAFGPDSKRLASASSDNTVQVWDAQTGKELVACKGHAMPVRGVAFSPDGKKLASASMDKTVKLWDAQTGKELRTLEGHTGRVWDVSFSPDGKRLASGGKGEVKLWDAETGKELQSFKMSGFFVFSPDSKRLAGNGKGVPVWDVQTGKELMRINGHTSFVNTVSLSLDGKRLASASVDKTVKVWDVETGQELLTFKGLTDEINSVSFSPDGKRLASGDGHEVKVWDAQTRQGPLHLKGHTGFVHSVAISPDGKRLASVSRDTTVKVWDAQTGRELCTVKGGGFGVAFSPDGKRLGSYGKVWDAQTGQELITLKAPFLAGGPRAVAFSPDGKRLAGCGKVWDAQTGQELVTLQGAGPNPGNLAFSPDGKRLANARGVQVKVWDAQTGKELLTLQGAGPRTDSVAFSPDGKRLASPADNSTIKVWDAQTGKELLTFKGHTGNMGSVAFSPDGKRLASGSSTWDDIKKTYVAEQVKVWDAQTAQELLTFKGGGVGVAFSPDSHRLAAGSADGTVKIWDATPLPEKR